MGEAITNITIVGGGTAGWMAALMLSNQLKTHIKSKHPMKITLIESPNIATVGVGEATVPGMPRTLQTAGISERAFFKACNATFKLGVYFDNWNTGPDGKPVGYINPFANAGALGGVGVGDYFLRFGAKNMNFTQVISPSVDLAAACHGPRPLGAKPYDKNVGFAYHLDAGKFAHLLRDTCIKAGVKHILDDVEGTELDERGYVAALQLKEMGRHPVELVIDCTGFRGLIINQALKEPFVNYSRYLANDRALAVQLPHAEGAKLEPITRSTALGAGWSWRVPLYNRVGTGYVFSSAHRTDEEARAEFLKHLGPDHKDAEPRVIPMRIGRNQNGWVKNCVSIGLSGGFIEPLESTAIHMIDTGIRWLVSYFPDKDFAAPLRDRYNKLTGNLYDEIRDFICLHYALGNRTDDPYWIDAREALEVPDSLAENLELWQYGLPQPFDLDFSSIFPVSTYTAVLLGKRVYETGYGKGKLIANKSLDRTLWNKYLAHVQTSAAKTVSATADHRDLVNDIRGDTAKSFAPTWPLGQDAPKMSAQKAGDKTTQNPDALNQDTASIL